VATGSKGNEIVDMTVTSYSTSINLVLLLVRLFLGPMIFTHGYRKVFRGGKLAGTGRWFDKIGMKPGKLHARAAAFTELSVGVLLTFGALTSLAAAGLIAVMLVAIVTVHRKNGFMISNPGEGIEYCLGVVVMALALGTLGAGEYSLDNAWGVFTHWTGTTRFLVTAAVGIAAATLQLVAFYRPSKPSPTNE
jgi:putative oxidoreductase